MRPRDLDVALAADREAGIEPIAVVANGGTTLTGAVDPIDELADVCEARGVWLHVDGAYGLPAAATADRPAGCSRASSAPTRSRSTPTSGSGVQKSCSLILVRERGALEAAFGHEEAYMRRDGGAQRRRADARVLAAAALAQALARLPHPRRGRRSATGSSGRWRWRASSPAWFATTPSSSCCASRPSRPCASATRPPASPTSTPTTRRSPPPCRRTGAIYLASAVVDGTVCLRVCFVNFRTRPEDVEFAVETVRELGARVAARA